jgi:hypothetical protein
MLPKILTLCCLLCFFAAPALAQQPDAKPEGPSTTPLVAHADSVLVTVILKHQQDKNLSELRRILEAQGFWEIFPPEDAEVLSWTIAMGLGHIITLKVPAGAVRRLNLAIENGAWGAYNSEIYLSYDYQPIWRRYVEQREDAKDDRN